MCNLYNRGQRYNKRSSKMYIVKGTTFSFHAACLQKNININFKHLTHRSLVNALCALHFLKFR